MFWDQHCFDMIFVEDELPYTKFTKQRINYGKNSFVVEEIHGSPSSARTKSKQTKKKVNKIRSNHKSHTRKKNQIKKKSDRKKKKKN